MSSKVINEAEEICDENVKGKKPNVIMKKQNLEPSCNHASKEIHVSETNNRSLQGCPRSKKMRKTYTKTEPKGKSNHDDVINPELGGAKPGHRDSKASFIRLSNMKELVRKAVRTGNCRVMVERLSKKVFKVCTGQKWVNGILLQSCSEQGRATKEKRQTVYDRQPEKVPDVKGSARLKSKGVGKIMKGLKQEHVIGKNLICPPLESSIEESVITKGSIAGFKIPRNIKEASQSPKERVKLFHDETVPGDLEQLWICDMGEKKFGDLFDSLGPMDPVHSRKSRLMVGSSKEQEDIDHKDRQEWKALTQDKERKRFSQTQFGNSPVKMVRNTKTR